MRRLLSCTRGASAVEFAVFAPMLCIGLLAMVDAGRAVAARMELDRNVRAGAQAAMSLNNDAAAIRAIVLAAAGAPSGLTAAVTKSCQCAAQAVACTAPCASGEPPSVFFDIEASAPHAGMIRGERTVASATRVQIR